MTVIAAGFETELTVDGSQVCEFLERLDVRWGGYFSVGTVETLTHTIPSLDCLNVGAFLVRLTANEVADIQLRLGNTGNGIGDIATKCYAQVRMELAKFLCQ